MKYFDIFKHPTLASLWTSQVLSAVGDQLYLLAAMWLAVEKFGSAAAFVAASITLPRILFGLLGGVIADRFDRAWIMILSDTVRLIAVSALPFLASYNSIQLWHLMLVGAIIGAFGALFDPALQASLPSISKASKQLQGMIGLMDLPKRLARVLGPGLIGLLVTALPIKHLFTLDAISFLVSAATILVLSSRLSWNDKQSNTSNGNIYTHFFRDLSSGMRLFLNNPTLRYAILLHAFACGTWGCAFMVGVPVLIKQTQAGIGDYGLIVGAYGCSGVIANITFANLNIRRKSLWLFACDLILASGFLIIGRSQSLLFSMLGASVAAVGGALGDLVLLNVLMRVIPDHHLGKVLSFRMVLLFCGESLGLILAGPLYSSFPASHVIITAALLLFLASLSGVILFGRDKLSRLQETKQIDLARA